MTGLATETGKVVEDAMTKVEVIGTAELAEGIELKGDAELVGAVEMRLETAEPVEDAKVTMVVDGGVIDTGEIVMDAGTDVAGTYGMVDPGGCVTNTVDIA